MPMKKGRDQESHNRGAEEAGGGDTEGSEEIIGKAKDQRVDNIEEGQNRAVLGEEIGGSLSEGKMQQSTGGEIIAYGGEDATVNR